MKYDYKSLLEFSKGIFMKIGFDALAAQQAANVLSAADLRGVDSHGIARLRGYINLWKANRLNPKANCTIVHETPSTATLDGDAGVGLVVAQEAMKIAIEKAKTVGTGWVSVRNSNHFGIAGFHAMLALEKNMIGVAMTNASPIVAPTFSTSKMLGTNPIAVAIPTLHQPPFVADFATTTVANGKFEILERQGKDAPLGWLQDAKGNPTTETAVRKDGGALLPLGSDRLHGSHKGYCLGSIVDIFSAVFSGANYSQWVPPFVSYLPLADNLVGEGIGHFIGAMRIDAFRPAEDFKQHMDNWILSMRQAEAVANQKVLVPGDPERELTAIRMEEGIPLHQKVVDDLKALSQEYEIALNY